MRIDVITLFPEPFRLSVGYGVVGRAIEAELLDQELKILHEQQLTLHDKLVKNSQELKRRLAAVYGGTQSVR